jgi:MFS family permease
MAGVDRRVQPKELATRVSRQLRDALSGLFDQRQPFGRLALVHSIFSAGTTLVTISLAGSLFFSASINESSGNIVKYLLLSLAPFAVVAPMLSPLLDRGAAARRASIGVASGGSALLALLMAHDLKVWLLFPEAFGILVLSKLYLVGKAALIPSMTESGDDLATANAKLAVLAAIAGFAVSPIGVLILQAGAEWVLVFTCVVFVAGAVGAVRLPRSSGLPAPAKSLGLHQDGRPLHGPPQPHPLPAVPPPSVQADLQGGPGGLIYRSERTGRGRPQGQARLDVRHERRRLGLPLIAPEVTVALMAMTVLRALFGFLTFFLAFALKHENAPAWWYGLILGVSGVGGLVGSMAVPRIRRRLSEQQLIFAALVVTSVVALGVALIGHLWPQPILAFAMGMSSTGAKPAFDSLGQRFVPPAALGRAFARFETQLQLCWVVAALVAVIVRFPFADGDVLISITAALAAAFHWSMRHAILPAAAAGQQATGGTISGS